jgi:putative DNA primase/helicase
MAKLVGARYVTASEPNARVRLNEAKLKSISGRDPITARHFRQAKFNVVPQFKLWLSCNHRPTVTDTSDGFWRRVIFFPFTQSFAARPDLALKDKLASERDGIFAWLVKGCLQWQRLPLSPPASMTAAVASYREESLPLADFIADRCIRGDAHMVQAATIYHDHVRWIGSDRAWTQRRFGEAMRQQFTPVPKHHVTYYHGIALRAVDVVTEETGE